MSYRDLLAANESIMLRQEAAAHAAEFLALKLWIPHPTVNHPQQLQLVLRAESLNASMARDDEATLRRCIDFSSHILNSYMRAYPSYRRRYTNPEAEEIKNAAF